MNDFEEDLDQAGDDVDLDRIAVIGMALRFPGADSPEEFWQNLAHGVESITRFSNEELLKAGLTPAQLADPTYVPAAGTLEDIELFDADLFGIGAREAELMDPQQRLFLTVAREALEDAGYQPGAFPGQVGVYAGTSISTYLLHHLHGSLDASGADLNLAKLVANDKDYLATLTAYKLDLRGPAVTVQTACSTSLVAVHRACQALLSMECDAALAGGVTVRVPHRVGYSNQGGSMLSAAGHCRAFDKEADGTVPGSGAGVIVLKRLADAKRDGDPVHAVILGSAVNNDGARKLGFTAPSVAGQAHVIGDALAVAGIEPSSLGYIEAHGTGTNLGDPVEIAALKQVLGPAGAAGPFCALGSVKTNMGHLECAAGVAGLIKTVLALKHAQIPPSLGFSEANPEIDFDASPVYVNDRLRPWPIDRLPRRAGVSSFGFGGTNCHVVVEQAPEQSVESGTPDEGPYLLPVSAREPDMMAKLRSRYSSYLQSPRSAPLGAICISAATTRRHETYRAVLLGNSTEDMLAALHGWAQNGAHPGLAGPAKIPDQRSLRAFLFTGQGAVYPGMGRDLHATEAVFRATVQECDTLLAGQLDRPIASVLCAADDDAEAATLLNQARFGQPALFTLEYALAMLWKSWGILPDFVMGHSLGEYVAAAVAGALSLADALRLVARRGALMQALPATGRMVAVLASEARVAELLHHSNSPAEIAAVNGPANVVVAGPDEAVGEMESAFDEAGIAFERLATSHAFHSALLEPMLADLQREAAALALREPEIPLISTLTGSRLGRGEHHADHWRRHSRAPVQFARGIETLLAAGCREFVEIGPHPVLCGMGRLLAGKGDELAACRWMGSLRRGRNGRAVMHAALAELYVAGAKVDWLAVCGTGTASRKVAVPVMPVRGQRHWIAPLPARATFDSIQAANGLLGTAHPTAAVLAQYDSMISTDEYPFLADHALASGPIFPATAYLDMALTATTACFRDAVAVEVSDIEILQPLMLGSAGEATLCHVQTVLRKDTRGTACVVELFSSNPMDGAERAWSLHVRARGTALSGPDLSEVLGLEQLRASCRREMSSDEFYAAIRRRGMLYGPAFRRIDHMAIGSSISLAMVRADGAEPVGTVNPATLDACCQAAGVFFLEQPEGDNFLPVAMGRLRVHRPLPETVWARARLLQMDAAGAQVDIAVCDSDGRVLCEISDMRFRRVPRQLDRRVNPETCLYVNRWIPASMPSICSPTAEARWLLLADARGYADHLAEILRAAGVVCIMARPSTGFTGDVESGLTLDLGDPLHYKQLIEVASQGGPLSGIVHLWSLNCDADAVTADVGPSVKVALYLSQAMLAAGEQPRLTVVTRNAHRAAPESGPCDSVQAPVWGFAAALHEEHPELELRLVDLDDAEPDVAAEVLWQELRDVGPDDRVSWRDGVRLALRLARRTPSPLAPYRLHGAATGMLDQLQIKPMPLMAPGTGEVLIRVRASGLNFRDVINALGMMPGNPGALGGECAGVVEAVGEGVDRSWLGQAVVCGSGGSCASHVVSDLRLIAPMPVGFSFEQAATLPIAYVTAHYGLTHLAQLSEGERVLIHSGAGGVGQAAIQIAQARGAVIFATAGSQKKREFLKAQGVDHVFDSRNLDFSRDIRQATGGEGVDVVLNALSDAFIPASLGLLRAGGRFLEIGKLGIWSVEQVAKGFPGVTYHIIALDRLIAERCDVVQTLLAEVMQALESGRWMPTRLRTFEFADSCEAFRYMQQARQIGKIALRHTVPQPLQPVADGTYLVTGGTGSLGLETARYLAQLGAGHITLAARRAPDAAITQAVSAIESMGATVSLRQVDIADEASVAALLEEIRAEGIPLRGIVHAAGVIEDASIRTQQWDAFARVLEPKMAGALALSRMSETDPLDFFVLYSSASGVLGAAGQGAYAAANAFLDALADHRLARGLPALSMAWGPWSIGMTSRLSETDRRRLSASGLSTLNADQYFALMQVCAANGEARAVAMSVDWDIFLSRTSQARSGNYLDAVTLEQAKNPPAPRWAESLEALPMAQRGDALVDKIAEQARRALGLAARDSLDPAASLLELGLDSLMAVELRNALAEAVGRRLPATLLFDYPSAGRLAGYFSDEVFGWVKHETARQAKSNEKDAIEPEIREEDMTAEMAAAMVAAELEKWSERNA